MSKDKELHEVKQRRELNPALPQSNGDDAPDFELLVIGGGSAGFAAAIKGAELGKRVALVEAL